MELVEDHNRADWFRLLRYNIARLRANVTLWLACQNRLATKTRLKNMNLIQCSLCSLCKEQDGDLDHLMFSCRVTKAIRLEVLKWMDIDHTPQMWRDEVRWVMQYTKGKGWKRGILKLAFSGVVYGIWIYRNKVVFENDSVNMSIAQSIIDTIVHRG
ncbi:hypothetical protein GmHk_15G043136 [Glycine max]|nr:hypothetical protein GmHk_15G043136 [Glycine max]